MRIFFIIFLFIFTLLYGYIAEAGIIKGRVTDEKNKPMEFVTIYVKGLNNTATTNEKGEYELLINPNGIYEIFFTFIGYKTYQKSIEITEKTQILDVQLQAEAYMLDEVTIRATDEDPAYDIIRKAQKKRKYYLNEEIKSSQCRIYTKGLQRMNKRPSSMFGQNITIDTGIIYLSESVSEVSFKQPKKWVEKMISSRVSGNNRGFSFNQASDAWINLYENINGQGMTQRGIVSPIAPNAMAYYRYKLVGTFQENGKTIYKINLLPKRKNTPAYAGYIQIMDETWRIHSAEVYLQKEVVEFIDSAVVQQHYKPIKVNDSTEVWVPSSQRILFYFKVFGFEGNGYFNYFFSNYNLEPNFPKKHFKSPIAFTVEENANKRDENYWKEIRPLPLSIEEVKDYRRRDSMQIVKESKPYQDSVDKHRNKFRVMQLFLSGYSYSNGFKKTRLYFPPLPSLFQYNTMEGLVINFAPKFRKTYLSRKFFTLEPAFRYGFSNRELNAKISSAIYFNPQKNSSITIEGGKFVEQMSRQTSITPFINAMYTLIDESNYLKLYQKNYGRLAFSRDITPAIRFAVVGEYANRIQMQNTTDYKWRDIADREFTPNIPFNFMQEQKDSNLEVFKNHNTFSVGGTLTMNFGAKYAIYPDRKFTIDSRYPTIRLSYKKGINGLGSVVNYDFVSLNITDDWNLGMVGKAEIEVEAGKFLNTKSMSFIDYRHFLGNQVLVLRKESGSFQLLNYYTHSTHDAYIKAHYEHHFGGFITNSLPLLKQIRANLVMHGNYLYTPVMQNYFEAGIGLETIYLSVHYFRSWETYLPQNQGIKLGFIF
jgi:hypothetical protein